jgi:hypothetical protein
VGFGGMIVDCGCGLSAEIADLGVEVQRADTVVAVRAGELHAVFDALNSVGFHCLNCIPALARSEKALVVQLK